VHEQAGSVWLFGFKLCHDILLLLNMADMDRWKTGVSNAEYLVHLVSMNRLSACREFCGVHSWQNGTRCRDGVKVFWCRSHLVWLVLRVQSLHALVFIQKTFCDLLLLLFLYCRLGMVREKRGGRGGQGEDAQSIKYI